MENHKRALLRLQNKAYDWLCAEPTHTLLCEEMYIFLIPFSNTLTSVPGQISVGLC